ncbi:hypothetical protein J6U76_04250 [bacterium]|nr:hypothetical protein [bacterium]
MNEANFVVREKPDPEMILSVAVLRDYVIVPSVRLIHANVAEASLVEFCEDLFKLEV